MRNGVFDNSFIVVAFAVRMVRNFARPQKWLTVHVPQLSDSGGDSGGFVCFPGSHKSQFPLPPNFRTRRSVLPPGAVSPPIKAGSVILFTVSAQRIDLRRYSPKGCQRCCWAQEAITHGTLPWTAPWTRRTLLYKYAAKHVLFMGPASPPSSLPLTERQRLLFEPASRAYKGWFADEEY